MEATSFYEHSSCQNGYEPAHHMTSVYIKDDWISFCQAPICQKCYKLRASTDVISLPLYPLNWYACVQLGISPYDACLSSGLSHGAIHTFEVFQRIH